MASHQIINPDLTFTQAEAAQVVKEYVCAVCHGSLTIQHIPNHERLFVMCPDHNNVCLVGRVMRSTVNYQIEVNTRSYYQFIAAMPDFFGGIWLSGIPVEHAEEIAHKSVCALCGFDLNVHLITDHTGKVFDKDRATVKCGFCNINVGLGGSGFAWKKDYVFIPPVKVREFQRARKARTIPPPREYSRLPHSFTFDKLGVVTFGTRYALAQGEQPDHLSIVVYDNGKYPGLQGLIEREYGSTPASVNVRLLSSPAPFPESLDCYDRGALFAKAVRDPGGNWEWFYFREPDTQEIQIRNRQALTNVGLRMIRDGVRPFEPVYVDGQGKPVYLENSGRLRFVIPEAVELNGSPVTGYFEMQFFDDSVDVIGKGVEQAKDYGWNRGMTLGEVPLTLKVSEGAGGKFVELEVPE